MLSGSTRSCTRRLMSDGRTRQFSASLRPPRSTVRGVLAACLAGLAATGCSLEFFLPSPTAQECPGALLEGTLAEGANGTAVVSWEAGEQPVQWPDGFVVEQEPVLRLLDDHGNVVASEGGLVYVGGGFTTGDELFIACGYVSSDPP